MKLISLTGIFIMLFLKFSLIPYFIGILVLCSLFTIDYKKSKKRGLIFVLLLSGLFLLNAISLFYSSNFQFGIKTVETQISLILLPVLIYFDRDFYYTEQNKIKTLFIYAAFASIIALIGIFIYNGKLTEILNYNRQYDIYSVLRYHKLSAGQHPSYISLGYLFAIILIWQGLKAISHKAYFAVKVVLIVILLSFIFFLNARAIFIAAFLVVIYFAIKYMTEHRLIYKIIIIAFLGFGFLFLVKNTRFKKVFLNLSNATNIEQVDLRFSLWRNAAIACKDKPIFGYGIGDSKEAIAKVHKQRNITEAVDYNLNAHNQFLETLIQTGLVGFILLCSLFVVALYQSIKKKQELLFLFLIITIVCFIFESMLQRLTGVVFLAFWYSFLTIIYLPNQLDETILR
jgi:O-antigen ligase